MDQDRIEELAASGNVEEAVQAVMSLPPETIEPTLIRLAGRLQAEAVPLLQALDQPDKPKAVAKSARRALHRLRSQGIAIPEVIPPPAEMGLIGGRRILRSLLSSVDGQGAQYMSVLISAPMTGMEGIDLVGSDADGIVEMAAVRILKREYEAHVAEMLDEASVIDAPADYVLFRVREYEAVNRRADHPLPSDYHIYRELFHMPGREYDRPLVYDEIGDVDLSLAQRAEELFQTKDFRTWFIREEIEPYVSQVIEAEESPIVLSDTVKQERVERILRSAAETIFTTEVRARYKRRLEENAYVLHHSDQADLARVALACALELAPDGPPVHECAIVREIIHYSLYVAFSAQQRESPIHRIGT